MREQDDEPRECRTQQTAAVPSRFEGHSSWLRTYSENGTQAPSYGVLQKHEGSTVKAGSSVNVMHLLLFA